MQPSQPLSLSVWLNLLDLDSAATALFLSIGRKPKGRSRKRDWNPHHALQPEKPT